MLSTTTTLKRVFTALALGVIITSGLTKAYGSGSRQNILMRVGSSPVVFVLDSTIRDSDLDISTNNGTANESSGSDEQNTEVLDLEYDEALEIDLGRFLDDPAVIQATPIATPMPTFMPMLPSPSPQKKPQSRGKNSVTDLSEEIKKPEFLEWLCNQFVEDKQSSQHERQKAVKKIWNEMTDENRNKHIEAFQTWKSKQPVTSNDKKLTALSKKNQFAKSSSDKINLNTNPKLGKKTNLSRATEKNDIYFPRCEYYARFECTTLFNMSTPDYWGTYFRSTRRGGNSDRYSKKIPEQQKVYEPTLVNTPRKAEGKKRGLSSYHSRTGAFKSPLADEPYKRMISNDEVIFEEKKQILFYDEILNYKLKTCLYLVKHFEQLTERANFKCPLEAYYHNDYPCVMIKIPAFREDKSTENWYEVAMAYFVAIVNNKALDKAIPIELVIRSSFGHNIPSVAATGDSFRINIGLIPLKYAELLAESLLELNQVIEILKEARMDSSTFKSINCKISQYNKEGGRTLPTWTSTLLFDILKSPGDVSNKPVIAQITRMRAYADLLADYVLQVLLAKGEHNIAQPLVDMLKSLTYDDGVVSFEAIKGYQFIDNKLSFPDELNNDISTDNDFWEILAKISQALQNPEISDHIEHKKLYGLYASLEAGNRAFIACSGAHKSEEGIGSDSDCECDGYANTPKFFSKKMTVTTGMRAINIATFLSLYHLKYLGKHWAANTDCMYFETADAIKLVSDSFDLFFSPEETSSPQKADFQTAVIVFFDLTHCDTENSEEISIQKRFLQYKNREIVCVLDYTSATTFKIEKAVIECLECSDVVILVSSGLKNEQMGADINPYGTVRIVTKDQCLLDRLYAFGAQALIHGKENLPQELHQIRKAYKKAGFTVTNQRIYKQKAHYAQRENGSDNFSFRSYEKFAEFLKYVSEQPSFSKLGFFLADIKRMYDENETQLKNLDFDFLLEWWQQNENFDLTTLTLQELMRLSYLLIHYEEEVDRLITCRVTLFEITAWHTKKIQDLATQKTMKIISCEEGPYFDTVEECYDDDSDITMDLINNGTEAQISDFQETFLRYQKKEAERRQREEAEDYGDFDDSILEELDGEDAFEMCPNEYFPKGFFGSDSGSE
jgi:hypothetical protein